MTLPSVSLANEELTGTSDAYDVNLSPDKRTILFHSENNLIEALKAGCFLYAEREKRKADNVQ